MGKVRVDLGPEAVPPRDGVAGLNTAVLPLTFVEAGPLGLELGWDFAHSCIVLVGAVPGSLAERSLLTSSALRVVAVAGSGPLVLQFVAGEPVVGHTYDEVLALIQDSRRPMTVVFTTQSQASVAAPEPEKGAGSERRVSNRRSALRGGRGSNSERSGRARRPVTSPQSSSLHRHQPHQYQEHQHRSTCRRQPSTARPDGSDAAASSKGGKETNRGAWAVESGSTGAREGGIRSLRRDPHTIPRTGRERTQLVQYGPRAFLASMEERGIPAARISRSDQYQAQPATHSSIRHSTGPRLSPHTYSSSGGMLDPPIEAMLP